MKSRRQFLAAAGASGLAPVTAKEPGGYIDSHVHVWTPNIKNYPLAPNYSADRIRPSSFTPGQLFAHSKPSGVSRIVLIQMSFYGFDNSYMLDMMKAHPGVFGGVAVIDAEAPDVRGTMLSLKEAGVRGFRIRSTREKAESWKQSSGMVEMWKASADHGLSMCLLADPDSLPASLEMAKQFPDTPVVIDHFARIGVRGTIDQKDVDNLLKFSELNNTRVKTSAFYALGSKQPPYDDLGPMIRQLRDAFGAERLMWATDCPYQLAKGHSYEDSIALIRDRLDFLTETDKQWILKKTAEQVFF